jgi:hypothetical protein
MRSRIASLFIAVAAALLLSACSDNVVVTDHHIRMAMEKCDANGGLKQVEQASAQALYENCGYRCTRKTDVALYKATFSCKNAAKFDLSWQE